MFYPATAFNQNIWRWNVARVRDLSYFLYGASAFNQDIGSWNVASVTTLYQTFYSASAFNQNIGSWNTASVTTMYQAWSLLQFSALTLCVGACRSCLVRHGLKLCAVPSACASAAIAAASSRPASAAPRTESMLGKHCQRLSSRVF